jgi:type I restriction enzyme R subunit
MTFYAGRLIGHPAMENPTLVVISDRNDLDDQLFGTFSMCRDLLRQNPQQADSREDLQRLLARPSAASSSPPSRSSLRSGARPTTRS